MRNPAERLSLKSAASFFHATHFRKTKTKRGNATLSATATGRRPACGLGVVRKSLHEVVRKVLHLSRDAAIPAVWCERVEAVL